MTENTFDMNAHFESIPVDRTKSEFFSALYRIEGICRQNWNTMPGDVQNAIMENVGMLLEMVRDLPDGLK